MKTVLVYAYTNFNLGDDLFIKVLCERYPDTRFILFAPGEYKKSLRQISNITLYRNDSILIRGIEYIFRLCKKGSPFQKRVAQKCDAVVYIGGSLFIQGHNWKKAFINKKNMRNKNIPFFLLGANFGPFKDKEFYLSYKEIFKEYTDICFRENYSYEMFKDLNNVRVADDIIFQMKTNDVQKQEESVVVSIIKPSRKQLVGYDEVYYEKIKDISVYFIQKGYKVILTSFCEKEGDVDAVKAIIDLIPNDYLPNVTEHQYKFNIEETLEIISKSRFIIGTRFHSMILGWLYNKPVFPIVYSEKMTNVMNDVGFSGNYIELVNIEDINPGKVFESIDTNLIDISLQVNNAEKHFEKLDVYLSKDN